MSVKITFKLVPNLFATFFVILPLCHAHLFFYSPKSRKILMLRIWNLFLFLLSDAWNDITFFSSKYQHTDAMRRCFTFRCWLNSIESNRVIWIDSPVFISFLWEIHISCFYLTFHALTPHLSFPLSCTTTTTTTMQIDFRYAILCRTHTCFGL